MVRLPPLILACALTIGQGALAEPLPVGPATMTVDVGRPIEVFTYKPATYTQGPLIVVFHGVARNAADYRNFALSLAERFGALVAAPRFDKERFPYEAYQRGGITTGDRAQPREEWTFSLVPKLVNRLCEMEGRPTLPVYFIGHSAGGQFLERMVALAGAQGAIRVIASNPGSHLFPTRAAGYGYGFGDLPELLSNDDAIRHYLEAPLTLYLGTADLDPNDEHLDRRPAALVQGRTRYERGLACFAAAQQLAREKGWRCNWRKVEAPDVGHDAARMFAAPEAGDAIFGTAPL